MVDIAKFFLQFTVDESCGKICTPCRVGTKRLLGSYWRRLQTDAGFRGYRQDGRTVLLHQITHSVAWDSPDSSGRSFHFVTSVTNILSM